MANTTNTTNLDQLIRGNYQNSLIAASVLSIFGLPGNIVVIILISRAKQKKSTMTYLLLSLAIADIVNLLGVDVIAIWHFLHPQKHKKVTYLLLIFPAKVATTFTLGALALERYDAVVKSMKIDITKKKILVGITAAWLVGTILCACMVHVVDMREPHARVTHALWTLLLLAINVPLVVILFCYASILKSLYVDGTILGRENTSTERMKETKRLIRILIVITLVFLACNVPTIVTLMVKSYRKSSESEMNALYLSAVVVECISSTLNPYVYGLQSKKYRSQVKELFSRSELVIEEQTYMTEDYSLHEVYDTKM